ncbi:3-deoxy-manno-octulosonate cytidylyltransferase [Spirosoma radiotolerans]|uniref:3-deoxy-manno-octulosonate cytidylyltransferase n=1 Tax=Spirosoma radiotolerans TaxID=1379870 RepID=A0A0E3ZWV8_9BACT|nr:3-deoxy-manno-octulosonate cytidylyltransferase [Spirosoma radiotolerans]AKD55979.1 3-deoxy-manno-octulosonate cytidylyltransferase [Spirosoma radiotolerans]
MIIGIIPARYGSSRFLGKPLADIGGKSMIQRVLEQANQATSLAKVVVATDDERIAEAVRRIGFEAVMTRTDHPSGTDRCWEAYDRLKADGLITGSPSDYILNIQGDEPFIDPAQIDELASVLDGTIELATQMATVDSAAMLHDPKEAKIVINEQNEALYFSRSAVPYLWGVEPDRWHEQHAYHRHVGLYAYRADVLEQITQLPPSPLERVESLEQLRWLEAGYRIKLVATTYQTPSVDSPGDIEKILQSGLVVK